MGFLAKPTPDMGPFCTEVRRESFVLLGPMFRTLAGSVEFDLAHIPHIRAALDQVERVANTDAKQ